jgi:hypothetical protein
VYNREGAKWSSCGNSPFSERNDHQGEGSEGTEGGADKENKVLGRLRRLRWLRILRTLRGLRISKIKPDRYGTEEISKGKTDIEET